MQKICSFLKSFSWAKIFIIFAALSFFLRAFFFFLQRSDIDFTPVIIVKSLGLGLFFDLLALSYIALIPLAYYTFIPNKFFNLAKHQIANRIFYFLFLFVIIFSCFSEVVFWDEFQTRFNFIAVDYLIYTTEVIANIIESYPIVLLVSAVTAIAAAIFFCTYKKIIIQKQENFFVALKILLFFAQL